MDEPVSVQPEGSQRVSESLGTDEMKIRDTTISHEHQKTLGIGLLQGRIRGQLGNFTWHTAHPLCADLSEKQSPHSLPVRPALYPRTSSILSGIEDVFRIIEGDDDGGFGVRGQGSNHAR